jgi:hypothetical protein
MLKDWVSFIFIVVTDKWSLIYRYCQYRNNGVVLRQSSFSESPASLAKKPWLWKNVVLYKAKVDRDFEAVHLKHGVVVPRLLPQSLIHGFSSDHLLFIFTLEEKRDD